MSFVSTQTSISALPLAALPAVVLDTETTGLNVTQDRVIEFGAVRLSGSWIEEVETYSALVNPGIAIPPGSSEIHHIGDADVAAAPGFAEAMGDFVKWSGPAVVIGFSIGFDLAILKAEHERNAMPWQAPRSLCVRHLVQLLGPNLPDPSLETIAAWLGLKVRDRHRALGDAVLTAQIFLSLIPLLRKRGISTLAEAERGCRSLTARLEEEAKAGWQGVGGDDEPGRSRVAEFAQVDSFPYRHRVADIMAAPPLVVAADASLRETLSMMAGKKVSSLFIAPTAADAGSKDENYGIVTERDVLRALDARGAAALEQPVSAFGQFPLVTIGSDEFVYRALSRMSTKGFRHLGVADPSGELVGALSARDLLRQRAEDAVSLGDSIEAADSSAELGRIWSDLTTIARVLVHEDVDARDVAAIISRELRALTRRACELAERDMAGDGKGGPPVPYAMLVLGSGGRGESLLAMDQDNAIVFSEGAAGGSADQWFEELGQRVADILNDAGVVYCKGGVMASKANWRKDLEGWREAVRSWISRSRPEDILNCDIFFDAVPVHGDVALADSLRREALEIAGKSRTFLNLLALNASRFDLPVGWFGRLQTRDGRVDLKLGGIMPLFSAARVLALRHSLTVRSTPERFKAFRALSLASEETIDNLLEAHRILLDLILDQQLRDIESGIPLSNKVVPGDLSAFERQQMKWALDQVPSVPGLLGTPDLG